MQAPTISVLTATFNSERVLPGLIESLRAQTDKEFEWVVVDGASGDRTMQLLEGASDLRPSISSGPDFGIYDALNRAILRAQGQYYLVLGSDDRLHEAAIETFRREAALSGADFVTASVLVNGQVLEVREGKSWRFGLNGFVSAHSVGTLIRRSLHEKYGLYSKKFPIAADQLFVTAACDDGALRHVIRGYVSGEFGSMGVSTSDAVGAATEFFRVQLLTGRGKLAQLTLLMARLAKSVWMPQR